MSDTRDGGAASIRVSQPWVDADMAWLYDTLSSVYVEDLPWYLDLADAQDGPVLELACGSGRILAPLAAAGHHVVGVDVSPDLLALARQRLAALEPAAATRVELVEGDMRTLALERRFGLAIIAARSFAYLISRTDQQRTLAAVAAHLRPGGLLALDLLNPAPGWLLEPPGSLRQDLCYEDLARGLVITRTEAVVSTDLASQVRVIRSAYDIVADGGLRKRIVEWPYRYTYRFEAELLLEQAGFDVVGVYGGFAREPFTADSKWLVLLARRRAEGVTL
jgi:SAM-dependent methyltransferase